MKTNLFLGDYSGMSYNDVVEYIADNFVVEEQEVNEYNILLATSSLNDYDESVFLILSSKIDGKLYIVDASHCSCYGFEDQFKPDETAIEYLMSKNAYFGWSLSDIDKENVQNQLFILIRYYKIEQLKNRMG